jgi:hypothetical protein
MIGEKELLDCLFYAREIFLVADDFYGTPYWKHAIKVWTEMHDKIQQGDGAACNKPLSHGMIICPHCKKDAPHGLIASMGDMCGKYELSEIWQCDNCQELFVVDYKVTNTRPIWHNIFYPQGGTIND